MAIQKQTSLSTEMIPDYKTNTVYLSGWLEETYPEVYFNLTTILAANNVRHETIPCTCDIWCRDYMPLQLSDNRFLCYRYYPDYLAKRKSYHKYITDSKEVCKAMKLSIKESSIIIDGGNVVKTGKKVIMTEKVFHENPDISEKSLRKRLQDMMECEVIFLPWDKYEKYGHADGIVKPVYDNTVLMTNYDDYDKEYYEEFKKRLSQAFDVEVLHYNSKNKDTRTWAYINFLSVGKLIILPKLNIEEDEQALNQIKQYYPEYTIEQVNSESIIAAGGGLNCISWCRLINEVNKYAL